MRSILGIDAAWTSTQPSGVALIQESLGQWQVLCVAPSYHSFLSAAFCGSLDWGARRFDGSKPDILSLLEAAQKFGATSIDVIAMDIPLARKKITTRRPSDSEISKAFGGKRLLRAFAELDTTWPDQQLPISPASEQWI